MQEWITVVGLRRVVKPLALAVACLAARSEIGPTKAPLPIAGGAWVW